MFKGSKVLLYIWLLTFRAYADESPSDESDSSNSGASPEGKSSENDMNYFVLLTQCDESNPTTTCTCDLTDALKSFAAFLSASQSQIFLQWESQLESTILVQVSLPAAQRAVMVYQSFSQFIVSYPDIYAILQFKTIKAYGRNLFLFKDLKKTALAFAIQTFGSSIYLDSNNNCPFFDALRSAANSCGASTTSAPTTSTGSTATGGTISTLTGPTTTPTMTTGTPMTTIPSNSTQVNCTALQANVNVLISQLTVTLQGSGSNSQLLVQVFQQLQTFFAQNAGSQAILCAAQISNFYSVQILFEITQLYYQASTVSVVFSGDWSTNVLLIALQSQVTNPAVPVQFQDLIDTLYDDLNGFFMSNSDINARFKQFSFLYYTYTTDTSDLQQYLDNLQLSNFGVIGDLIIVSATISFTAVDFSQIDQLINNTNGWNNTLLVQAFFYTNNNWNITYYFHGYFWTPIQWIWFRNTFINNNISLIISDTALTNLQKHKRINVVLQQFIKTYPDKQFFYCTPLPNGLTLADYRRYVQASPPWKCEVPRGCMALRNNLIQIKSDNTTDVTNGFLSFFTSCSQSELAIIMPFYNQVVSVIYGPVPSGGIWQLVAQVVQILLNLLEQVAPPTTPFASTAVSAAGGAMGSTGSTGSTAGTTKAGSTATTGSTAVTGSTSRTGSTASTTPTYGTTATPSFYQRCQNILFSNWGHLQKFCDCQGPKGTNTQIPSK